MNIFVGNLNFSSTEDALRVLFEAYGTVRGTRIIPDPRTGRPRGFVEMPADDEATAAIAGLDGREFDGRPIQVLPAGPRAL